MALFAIDLEVESIDQDLAIDHLANLLEHLDTTRIDLLTMSRITILDHCPGCPSELLQSLNELKDCASIDQIDDWSCRNVDTVCPFLLIRLDTVLDTVLFRRLDCCCGSPCPLICLCLLTL